MTKKILLADDSLTIQKVVELTFSDSEYDLVCVSNGQRALDRIAAGEVPDLILADVVMPEKNGYEVCEAIKANPSTARIPVVLLSGTFEPFDRDRAERLGCDAIVSKPFDSQQLLRQVEQLLSRPAADVPVASTVAIPTMANLAPPPPPPPEPAASEAGFKAEDFTGSIRVPTPTEGGADLFEEEYGQADVESAIAAFEKAHPEFTYAEEGRSESAPAQAEGHDEEEVSEESHAAESASAGWIVEEPESSSAPAPPAPAPFWIPREPEPDVAPIPFSTDDSASRHAESQAEAVPAAAPAPAQAPPPPPEPPRGMEESWPAAAPPPVEEPWRADEAPTQQIPLAAEYAALARRAGPPADRETDPTAPRRPEPAPLEGPSGLRESGPLGVAPVAPPPPPAESPVPAEIEELASTTSIGQLKEMFSSVSRPEGGLSDDDIDRLAARVVERLSERIVREIAWEVIPDVAEIVIKQRIKELEAGVE